MNYENNIPRMLHNINLSQLIWDEEKVLWRLTLNLHSASELMIASFFPFFYMGQRQGQSLISPAEVPSLFKCEIHDGMILNGEVNKNLWYVVRCFFSRLVLKDYKDNLLTPIRNIEWYFVAGGRKLWIQSNIVQMHSWEQAIRYWNELLK